MGSMVFKKIEGGEVVMQTTFDSSPKYSLCKAHGLRPESFRLDLTSDDGQLRHYDVYGTATEGAKAAKIGVLSAKSKELIRAELARQ